MFILGDLVAVLRSRFQPPIGVAWSLDHWAIKSGETLVLLSTGIKNHAIFVKLWKFSGLFRHGTSVMNKKTLILVSGILSLSIAAPVVAEDAGPALERRFQQRLEQVEQRRLVDKGALDVVAGGLLDLRAERGALAWFSSDPADLDPLKGGRWSFTFTIESTFTRIITCGTTVATSSDGSVALPCSDDFSDEGFAFYTELPEEAGGGIGFIVGIDNSSDGDELYTYYMFKIGGNSANGAIRAKFNGQWSSYFALSGACLSGCPQNNPGGNVNVSGSISAAGLPLCAMVLANGQYMFSCDPAGQYNLNVPLNSDGQITLFGFADGLMPFKAILNSWETSYDIKMQACQ